MSGISELEGRYRQYDRTRNYEDPRTIRGRHREPVPQIPGEVSNAIEQVIGERPDKSEQDDFAERRRREGGELIEGFRATRDRDQPPAEQDGSGRQRKARHAVHDRRRHRDRPTVYAQMWG